MIQKTGVEHITTAFSLYQPGFPLFVQKGAQNSCIKNAFMHLN